MSEGSFVPRLSLQANKKLLPVFHTASNRSGAGLGNEARGKESGEKGGD